MRLPCNNTIGYRVLNVYFVDANNNEITIPGYNPQIEDPSTWTAPAGYEGQASIDAGKALFEKQNSLKDPTFASFAAPRSIKASCVDCHVKNGTDLKYYSFSNLSIIERAKFHGLSDVQGKQIAAYIRSNSSPAPGRPWNPPYQPGPGTDSKPIQEWAAGAGIDWVLPKDRDSLPYLFPNGIGNVGDIAVNKNRSAREIPVALQFPDWNHWLPKIHPMDAWGDAMWTSSTVPKWYDDIRTWLSDSNAKNFKNFNYPGYVEFFNLLRFDWTKSHIVDESQWTPEFTQTVYGTALWNLVKNWELEHEFGLEGYSSNWYGPNAESRIWPVNTFFMSSPFMLAIPGNFGVGGNNLSNEYFSNVWYHVQLVVNNSSNGSGEWSGNNPVDPLYWIGKGKDLVKAGGAPDAVRLLISQQKFYYGRAKTGIGPDDPLNGWDLRNVIPSWLIDENWAPTMEELSSQDKIKVYNAFLRVWLDESKKFTPAQYYAGNSDDENYRDANYVPKRAPDAFAGPYADRIYFMIPYFRDQGADSALLNEICDWAKTV